LRTNATSRVGVSVSSGFEQSRILQRVIMKSVRKRGEHVQIMLSAEELDLLDEFRFEKRMPTRASAIRELLKRGLAAEGFAKAARGAKSSEYGVSGKTPTGRRAK
jgi:hypothetical protein